MSAQGREATGEDSKLPGTQRPARGGVSPLTAALAGLGLAGAILAFVSAWEPIIRIFVITVEKASYTGLDRHSVALPALGAFGLLMVIGSARGARPAMIALAACGLAVLLIAVVFDLPHLNDSGIWPQSDLFEEATARKGPGYLTELASGICMLLSGVGLLVLGPRRVRGAEGAGFVRGPENPPPPPAPAQSVFGAPAVPAPSASSERPSRGDPLGPSPSTPATPASSPPPRDEPLAPPPPRPTLDPAAPPPAAAHPSEERDPFAPRERPPVRRRQGGLVGRLRRGR